MFNLEPSDYDLTESQLEDLSREFASQLEFQLEKQLRSQLSNVMRFVNIDTPQLCKKFTHIAEFAATKKEVSLSEIKVFDERFQVKRENGQPSKRFSLNIQNLAKSHMELNEEFLQLYLDWGLSLKSYNGNNDLGFQVSMSDAVLKAAKEHALKHPDQEVYFAIKGSDTDTVCTAIEHLLESIAKPITNNEWAQFVKAITFLDDVTAAAQVPISTILHRFESAELIEDVWYVDSGPILSQCKLESLSLIRNALVLSPTIYMGFQKCDRYNHDGKTTFRLTTPAWLSRSGNNWSYEDLHIHKLWFETENGWQKEEPINIASVDCKLDVFEFCFDEKSAPSNVAVDVSLYVGKYASQESTHNEVTNVQAFGQDNVFTLQGLEVLNPNEYRKSQLNLNATLTEAELKRCIESYNLFGVAKHIDTNEFTVESDVNEFNGVKSQNYIIKLKLKGDNNDLSFQSLTSAKRMLSAICNFNCQLGMNYNVDILHSQKHGE